MVKFDKQGNPLPDEPVNYFIYNECTLREVATLYDIKYNTITKISSREQWSKQREEINKAIHKGTKEEVVRRIVQDKADALTPMLKMALDIQEKCIQNIWESLHKEKDALDVLVSKHKPNERIHLISYEAALAQLKEEGGKLPTEKEFLGVPGIRLEDI